MAKVSAGVNRGSTPDTTTKTRKSRGAKAIKNMTASKHIDLAPIISGTPSLVREKFKELEENGDLIRDEACEPTDPPDPSELIDLDSEVEMTDEDALLATMNGKTKDHRPGGVLFSAASDTIKGMVMAKMMKAPSWMSIILNWLLRMAVVHQAIQALKYFTGQ